MPLLRIKSVADDVLIGFWRIDNTERAQLLSRASAELQESLNGIKSEKRQSEIAAVNALSRVMTKDDDAVLMHDKAGRPMLNGYNVSVSHTKGLAAVILSKSRKVAIDVEHYSERVNDVAHVFLRKDEEAGATVPRLLHWCAKETLYKLLSEERLRFGEMRVKPFAVAQSGAFTIEDLRSHNAYTCFYECKGGFVMTYSY